jgi:hypothetical protein
MTPKNSPKQQQQTSRKPRGVRALVCHAARHSGSGSGAVEGNADAPLTVGQHISLQSIALSRKGDGPG